jgi:quinol monooxygenase YgiN
MKYFEPIVFIGVGICLSYLYNQISSSINDKVIRKSSTENAFFLGVVMKFKTIKDKNKFKVLFKPYAQWVAVNELETISYEMSESDKDELQIFILERYITKNDYLEKHRKSNEFIEFRAKLLAMGDNVVLEGHSYIDSNYGFV